MSRFSATINIVTLKLLEDRYAKSTKKMDKYIAGLLRTYCVQKQFDYNSTTSLVEWDSLLVTFYASIKKDDGGEFNTSSINSIRYSTARLLKEKLHVDILHHNAFTKSNNVHAALRAKLKRLGKGSTKQFDVISDEDQEKLALMLTDTPIRLQWKVWLTVMLHFLNRGMENMHSLLKSDLIFSTNPNAKQTVTMRDQLTKNHRGINDNSRSNEAIIYDSNSFCSISLMLK
jgi:hypothetical protein